MGLSVAATMTPRKSGIKNRCAQCSAKTGATVARMICATFHGVVGMSADSERSAGEAILRAGASMEPAVFAILLTMGIRDLAIQERLRRIQHSTGPPLLGEPPGCPSREPNH